MIACYMDESFDMKQQGIFAVGCVMGRGVQMFELERRWETLRKQRGLAFFKASQCARGKGEFAQFVAKPGSPSAEEQALLESISLSFIRLILNPVPWDPTKYICVHGVGVDQQDFYKVSNSSPRAQEILGRDPYRLGYAFAMIQCAWVMKQLGTGEHVSFMCDESEQYSPLAAEAYQSLLKTNPSAAGYMGTFSFSDEKKCEQLQAADAAVFEIRRVLKLALGLRCDPVSSQFRSLAGSKIVALLTHAGETQLQQIVDTHTPGEPFRLDELMQFQFEKNISLGLGGL